MTHDQEEAFALADRTVILHRRHIEQAGTPADIRAGPATAFVRRFIAEPPAPARRAG